MMLAGTHRWAWATAALAAALAAGLSWVIARSPLTLYDGLGPILDSMQSPSVADMWAGAWHSAGYWRPLRLAQIKAVVDAYPSDPTFAFKTIHVALTMATFGLFAAWLRPASWPEFTAAAIALMVLAGHHSFFILFAEAYPINHFLEIVALALLVALLARGAPRWWKDVLAPMLLVIGMMTIESGLLVGVVAIACRIAGWRGISWRGVAAVVIVLAGYLWMRFVVLDITSPGIDERATGWWLTRLEPSELARRFGDNPLPLYAYNLMAAFIGVLMSEPRSGFWRLVAAVVDNDVPLWMVAQVASSAIVTGAMVAALVPALARWRGGAASDRDRFVLVAFALVAANTAMSYGYVKDEVLSVGAAFYAAGAFAALAGLAERVRTGASAHVLSAVVLLFASLLWTSRTATTLVSLQASAYKVANDWALYSLEREAPEHWSVAKTREAFFELRQKNIMRGVPHPRHTIQPRVDAYLEIQ